MLVLLKRLLRRSRRTAKRELQWLRRRLQAFVRRREMERELNRRLKHRSRRARRRRSTSRDVDFRSNTHWAWSIRVLEDEQLIAFVQAANPLALLSLVEEYVLACGDPQPPRAVVLRCNANGNSLRIDRSLIGHEQPTSDQHRIDAIRQLDQRIDHHMEQYHDSSSMTVMTDPLGNPLRMRELLSTTYGEPRNC